MIFNIFSGESNTPPQEKNETEPKVKTPRWVRRTALYGMFMVNAFTAFGAGGAEANPSEDSDSPETIAINYAPASDVDRKDVSRDLMLSPEDFQESRLDTLQFVNYFQVDKAEISPDNAEIIANEFRSFLDKVDASNVGQLLDNEFIVFASCDERESKYQGTTAANHLAIGNEQLAYDRAAITIPILKEVLDNYDFQERIDQAEIQGLGEKVFKIVTPKGGVLFVENLDQLSDDERAEKYAENRKVDFMLGMESSFENLEDAEIPTEFESMESSGIVDFFNQYDKVLFAADVSPSMGQNYDRMMAGFKASYKETGIDPLSDKIFSIIPYSDEIHTKHARIVSSQDDMSVTLDRLTSLNIGGTKEIPLDVMIELVEKTSLEEGTKKLLSITFDEGLQGVSTVGLQTLAAQAKAKGLDVAIFMIRQSDGHVTITNPEKLAEIISLQEATEDFEKRATYDLDVNETRIGDQGAPIAPDILVQIPDGQKRS